MTCEDFDSRRGNIIAHTLQELCSSYLSELEKIILEGLKRKGFEFKNDEDYLLFGEGRCRVEDNVDSKERTYFVDDVPFLIHRYGGTFFDSPSITKPKAYPFEGLGSYAYV